MLSQCCSRGYRVLLYYIQEFLAGNKPVHAPLVWGWLADYCQSPLHAQGCLKVFLHFPAVGRTRFLFNA